MGRKLPAIGSGVMATATMRFERGVAGGEGARPPLFSASHDSKTLGRSRTTELGRRSLMSPVPDFAAACRHSGRTGPSRNVDCQAAADY